MCSCYHVACTWVIHLLKFNILQYSSPTSICGIAVVWQTKKTLYILKIYTRNYKDKSKIRWSYKCSDLIVNGKSKLGLQILYLETSESLKNHKGTTKEGDLLEILIKC